MDVSLEWTLGDGDGQGGLACCDSWGHNELDTTEQPNWPELKYLFSVTISNDVVLVHIQITEVAFKELKSKEVSINYWQFGPIVSDFLKYSMMLSIFVKESQDKTKYHLMKAWALNLCSMKL